MIVLNENYKYLQHTTIYYRMVIIYLVFSISFFGAFEKLADARQHFKVVDRNQP